MKVGIIVNPVAGPAWKRRSREACEAWVRGLAGHFDVEPWIALTDGPGHAYELARQALDRGASLVIAWGGDGTVNEVASALVYSRGVLGIVPVGSGNGLARELGISAHPEAAMTTAIDGAERQIDAGEINGRLFFNVAGIGFDAHVAEVFARRSGRTRGVPSYIATTLVELFRYTPSHYTVTPGGADDGPHDAAALLVSIANTTQWGNGATIAPHARLDDGHLDMVLIPVRPKLVILGQLWRLFTGSVGRLGGTVMQPVRHVVISAAPAAPVHADGEPIGLATTIEAAVRPAALRVRVQEVRERAPAVSRSGLVARWEGLPSVPPAPP